MKQITAVLLFALTLTHLTANATPVATVVTVATEHQAVTKVLGQLFTILRNPNSSQRVHQLCHLTRTSVDTRNIALAILGPRYSRMERDRAGINAFNQLMPSIVVSEFYDVLKDRAETEFQVNPSPIPKGSSRVGFRVDVGSTQLVVTLTKASLKVYDVEGSGYSLVRSKSEELQRELDRYWNMNNLESKPVSSLVQDLLASGRLLDCGN